MSSPLVVVAMLTYRRPVELARALPLLAEQRVDGDARVAAIVIDNDPDGGAADVVRAWADRGIEYAHEPRPGISSARNRAIDEALRMGAAAVVFIDDDETPGPHWLRDLVATWQAAGCAAVTGPVRPSFAQPPDEWVLASDMFARRRHPTGTRVRSAATNNLLLDLGEIGLLRFADDYGLVGGEDTIFTHELVRLGRVIVWCDEAEVVEHVPAERLSHRWILKRDFRAGTSYSAMWLRRPRSRLGRIGARADLALRGIVRIVGASARIGVGILTGNVRHRARGASLVAANAGLVAGAFGVQVAEYRRPKVAPIPPVDSSGQ